MALPLDSTARFPSVDSTCTRAPPPPSPPPRLQRMQVRARPRARRPKDKKDEDAFSVAQSGLAARGCFAEGRRGGRRTRHLALGGGCTKNTSPSSDEPTLPRAPRAPHALRIARSAGAEGARGYREGHALTTGRECGGCGRAGGWLAQALAAVLHEGERGADELARDLELCALAARRRARGARRAALAACRGRDGETSSKVSSSWKTHEEPSS